MLHITLEKFVEQNFGLDVWKAALKASGLNHPLDAAWDSVCPYHDMLFTNLVTATAQLVNKSQTEIWTALGRFSFQVCPRGEEG